MSNQQFDLPTKYMIAEKDGAVGRLIFNNPDRHNAVKLEMWEAIPVILDIFEADDDIKVVVLEGAGERAFVSGADISEFETVRATPEGYRNYENTADAATDRLADCSKPTIAMIHGFCMGGGAGIAVACDLRFASDESRFGVPAAKLGVGYRAGGIAKVLDLVGPSFTKEIFFTARQFTAEEALQMGLINRMVEPGLLRSAVADYCDTIAVNAPLSIKAVKKILKELTRKDAGPNWNLCENLVEECFASEDYIEGRRAFMEKRKAVFTGK
jgi:enoyl-CoA hydratase/carnithine racemase